MDCEWTDEELAEYAAGEADPDRADAIRAHLAACDACRRRVAEIRATDLALRALPRLEPSPGALLAARQALSRELRGTGAPEIMTLEEAAEFLRVTADDLRDVVGDLPAFEIAGKVRVRRAALLQWVGQRERLYAQSRAESELARALAGLQQEGAPTWQ